MTPFFPMLAFSFSPIVGYLIGGWGLLLTPFLTFVFAPTVDAIFKKRPPWKASQPQWAYDFSLYAYFILHFVLIIWGAYRFSSGELSGWERAGLVLSVGLITGGIGITYAHELIHRRSKFARTVGELILSGVCYGHFAVEHVYGHHVNVATAQCPVSAARGVSFYRYYPRAVIGSFVHALKLKPVRVAGACSVTLAIAIAPTVAWGWEALAFLVAQSFIAFTLLELIDYVEHYGLRREHLPDGRYEAVKAHHSWDTDGALTSLLLANLQRHSDHHLHPLKPYEQLELLPKAPRLPGTYPLMVLLALAPPLWRRVMDSRIPSSSPAPSG
jgi:alkane 1-monooxygenase